MKPSLRLKLTRCVSARLVRLATGALSFALLLSLAGSPARADDGNGDGKIKRVLLISVDGMHSLDMVLWVKSNPNSAMAGAGACAPGELPS